MSKGFISDDMIEDIIKEWSGVKPNKDEGYSGLKDVLSNYGYEVEQNKSKLELARDCWKRYTRNDEVIQASAKNWLIQLANNYIEELQQQKPKIDNDLIEWLKSWDYENCFGAEYLFYEDNENMKRFLKQLGIK